MPFLPPGGGKTLPAAAGFCRLVRGFRQYGSRPRLQVLILDGKLDRSWLPRTAITKGSGPRTTGERQAMIRGLIQLPQVNMARIALVDAESGAAGRIVVVEVAVPTLVNAIPVVAQPFVIGAGRGAKICRQV